MVSSRLKICAIIPTRNRPRLLEQCLKSLNAAAALTSDKLEIDVRLGINGQDHSSSEVARLLEAQLAHTNLSVQNFDEAVSPAAARNRLLLGASGDWIFFVDDDAFVEKDFFLNFYSVVKNSPQAAVIGGPNLTPKESTRFQLASGAALASRFGAGRASLRYTRRFSQPRLCGEEGLILCNMLIRMESMNTVRFPEQFICNEENWIMQELCAKNSKMVHAPSLYVWHSRRASLGGFVKQVHAYGTGRGQNIGHRPTSMELEHVIPLFCVLFSIFALVAGSSGGWARTLWLGLFAIYLTLWIGATLRLWLRREGRTDVVVLAASLFPVIHCCYGFGVLRGLALTATASAVRRFFDCYRQVPRIES